MHPGQRILAVFQPHLFSRTRDFGDAFARSLSQFDEVVLMDIYPARELPIAGITADWLFEKIVHPSKQRAEKDGLWEVVEKRNSQVIVFMGAGDISEEVEKISKKLRGEN